MPQTPLLRSAVPAVWPAPNTSRRRGPDGKDPPLWPQGRAPQKMSRHPCPLRCPEAAGLLCLPHTHTPTRSSWALCSWSVITHPRSQLPVLWAILYLFLLTSFVLYIFFNLPASLWEGRAGNSTEHHSLTTITACRLLCGSLRNHGDPPHIHLRSQ